ncbi:hypothetical protein Taro_036024 [Colocasia esculenta]|uniref:Dirigent protein n=1 Tax=Colocasia esculenta TaxID=4460 RepID=A0A843WC70_COLES|nr:hypothetical protein [Colocasia esculenta]
MASFLRFTSTAFPAAFSFLLISIVVIMLLVAVKAQDGFDFGPEKKTHLHFFFHDVVTGPSPTATRVVEAATTNSSSNGFGAVVMIDDALTERPDPSSKLVGRAQGMYALASRDEVALLMALNYHFVDGDYNGSTLAVLGRNSVFSATREMSVVGGTGYFRLARGYAVAKTHTFEMSTGNAVVEYDVYVVHRGGPQWSEERQQRSRFGGSNMKDIPPRVVTQLNAVRTVTQYCGRNLMVPVTNGNEQSHCVVQRSPPKDVFMTNELRDFPQ